jgi:anionic cell wall polymer biosynthesis LytR-Cps2A-Psr (LCP) family protein
VYSTTKRLHDEETAFKAIMGVVSEITGQEINYYFMMDFNGFKSLIDHIGGVEIDVPERLYDSEYPTKNW